MIALIAAVAANRAIGRNNQLLWHLPEDMRHFRDTTRGKPVIMGRKTWESLPPPFRPLPGRRNIVVTRNPAYSAPGAELAHSLEEALTACPPDIECFVIGGAELYRQALPLAQRLYLTEVADTPAADTFFPALPQGEWRGISRQPVSTQNSPDFAFVTYERV